MISIYHRLLHDPAIDLTPGQADPNLRFANEMLEHERVVALLNGKNVESLVYNMRSLSI